MASAILAVASLTTQPVPCRRPVRPRARPGLELFQRGVNRLDATPDRFLRALAHGFEPLGDFSAAVAAVFIAPLAAFAPSVASAYISAKMRFISVEPLFVALVASAMVSDVKMAANTSHWKRRVLDALHQHLDHENAALRTISNFSDSHVPISQPMMAAPAPRTPRSLPTVAMAFDTDRFGVVHATAGALAAKSPPPHLPSAAR